MFILLVLFIYFNWESYNSILIVDECSDYFSSSELQSLQNMCWIFALMFIWLAWLLLRDCNFVECGYDENLIFYDRHKSQVELVMRHVKFLCWECLYGLRKDLGLQMWYLCWILFWVGRQESLTVETLLKSTSSRGRGDKVSNQRVLRGGYGRMLRWRASVFLYSHAYLCVCNDDINAWAYKK